LLLVWNILLGNLEQTISVTFNGPVSAAVWTPISPNRPSTTFAFGCADGTMFAYHQTHEDVKFSFSSHYFVNLLTQEPYRMTCLVPAHDGRIETLAFDTHHRRIASAGSGCAKVWQLDMEGQNFFPLLSHYANHVAKDISN
jgi:WD40 repeat protein